MPIDGIMNRQWKRSRHARKSGGGQGDYGQLAHGIEEPGVSIDTTPLQRALSLR